MHGMVRSNFRDLRFSQGIQHRGSVEKAAESIQFNGELPCLK